MRKITDWRIVGETIYAQCDDKSLWTYYEGVVLDGKPPKWQRIPDIPCDNTESNDDLDNIEEAKNQRFKLLEISVQLLMDERVKTDRKIKEIFDSLLTLHKRWSALAAGLGVEEAEEIRLKLLEEAGRRIKKLEELEEGGEKER